MFMKERIHIYEISRKSNISQIMQFSECNEHYFLISNQISLVWNTKCYWSDVHWILEIFRKILIWHPSKSNSKYLNSYLSRLCHFFIFDSVKIMFEKLSLNKEMGRCWKSLIRMLLKLRCCQITYLFAGFKTIILCSVHPI